MRQLSISDAEIAARAARFDYSGRRSQTPGAKAAHNWKIFQAHTSAEWLMDIDVTMQTMTVNEPFQIMHATGLDVRGHDNMRAFYSERFKTFQGQGFFPHNWAVTDDVIVGNGYFHGAPSGKFFGVEAHGKTLCVPITIWIYFEDGLIKGESSFLDGNELRRQIEHGTTRTIADPVF